MGEPRKPGVPSRRRRRRYYRRCEWSRRCWRRKRARSCGCRTTSERTTKEEDGWRQIVEDDDDTQFRRCYCKISRFFDFQMREQFCASIKYTGFILLGCVRLQVSIRCIPHARLNLFSMEYKSRDSLQKAAAVALEP